MDDTPASREGRGPEVDPLPGDDLGVDPQQEQVRLVNVSETRADAYGAQAGAARTLRTELERTETDRRQLELLGAERLQHQIPQFAVLDLTSMIRRGARLEELLQRVVEHSVELFEAQKSSILIPDESGTLLCVAAAWSLTGEVRQDFTMPIGDGVAGYVHGSGERLVVPNTAECELYQADVGADRQPKYLVAIPLAAEGEKLGVLCLERPLGLPASPHRIDQLERYAAHAATQLCNIRFYERLRRQVDELSVLCEISRELSSSLKHEALLQKIVESAASLLQCGMCSLMLFEDDKQSLRIRYAVPEPDEAMLNARIVPGTGVAGWVVENEKPLLIEDITKDERFKPRDGGSSKRKYTTRSLLSVPLMIGSEIVGVLNVNNKANNAVFNEHDLANLNMLASQAAVSIENARLYETLQRLAVTDPLTKLFRRNHFEEQLEQELGRCRRYGRPLSLMMLDIDYFKRVNDTYGHPVGDTVLQALAGLLRRYGRKDDVICRFGGEEFVAYLVETDEDGAKLAAERIRSAAEAQAISIGGGRELRITVSVGTASYPAAGDNGGELVRKADLALYAAKHGGRNRVCQYYDGMEMPEGGAKSDR